MPGNLPTMTSRSVVAAGEIFKLFEGLDILSFWPPQETKIIRTDTASLNLR